MSNTHTNTHTLVNVHAHIFSVEGHKCGFVIGYVHMFRSICTQVLYLMDCFNVSDKFYHELSMVQLTIPRSHRIKRVRSELNELELEVIVSTAAHDVPNCIRFS